jgi:hypothetical protein
MDENRGMLKQMDEFKESMKLIMAALNIGGVENRKTKNEDIGAIGGSNL